MNRAYIQDLGEKVGSEVSIFGWIDVRRDHGKLIFLDIRDRTGKVQCVALPTHAGAYGSAEKVRSEWVVSAKGKVNKRPEKMAVKGEPNGMIEIELTELAILNEAKTPPFDIHSDGYEVNEEKRLEHRYIDLRRSRLQRNIRMRHAIISFIREKLSKQGFVEVETPILTKSTPEGARDYIVPSRLEPGRFYALPQAPQQYKQFLMVSGFEKYFQIARCFRDEDTRADRQPEFTQLDMEMSFVEREDVMALNEKLLIDIVTSLFPKKKIAKVPFPRLTYAEAMKKYGTDRPDLRPDKKDPDLLSFCWVIDFPFFEKAEGGGWTFTHNPFSAPQKQHEPLLMKKERIGEILTNQYDVVLNGFEIGGGSIRSHNRHMLEKVFEIMGYEKAQIEGNFGHMLRAFETGAPPHGGIAWGLDRVIALLENEESIREVIAFPKTGEGKDLMMSAPSEVEPRQLKELGIELKRKK